MAMPKQSPADIRLALLNAGFTPVACINKEPILKEWQNRHDATPEQIAKWPGANTGIATKNAPTCDIDIDLPEPAACVEDTARDWFDGRGIILTRFGKVPRRALLFRTSAPFPKIIAKFRAPDSTKHKIEFLGDGQQVVVDGTHPDTGQEYRWHADLCPWNLKHEDLVEITEQEAHEFLAHASDVLEEQFGFTRILSDGNGHDDTPGTADMQQPAHGDIDERLASIASGADANEVQPSVIATLLHAGEHPDDVLVRVVDATVVAAERHGLSWSRTIEEMHVRQRILAAYKNCDTLLRKYDPASGVIPDWLPGEFHPAWLRVLKAGGRPMWHYNHHGFCIKSAQQNFPARTADKSTPTGTSGDSVDDPDTTADNASSKTTGAKKETPTRGLIHAIPFRAFDEAKLPPREWLYASHYQRGQVTATIGPGGAGKSSVDLVEGIAMATARNLLGEQPTLRCRVWIHNGDDDREEMNRRIAAVCRHYQIPMIELEGWLWVTTKTDTDIKLGAGNGTLAVNRVAVDAIISTILQNEIDVFIAEPLVTLHGVPENNNTQMNAIVHLLSGVADSCDCAIEICHHTRKLLAGFEEYSTDDGRGASAIRDAVRGSRVLNSLSRDEAREVGIEEQQRAFYFRVDRGKANYLPPAVKATWRKFENVELLNGDQVGVVTVWEFPGSQGAPSEQMAAAEQAAESLFMQLLARLTLEGRTVSDSAGSKYAPLLFAREPEAKAARIGKETLAAAMRRLFKKNRIRVETSGRGGRRTHSIVIA
jgi:RecA-family ATPase